MQMKKLQMKVTNDVTFEQGFNEYIENCKARNLRQATIHHYVESSNQLYKFMPRESLVKDMSAQTFDDYVIFLKEHNHVNDITLQTYSRDLKVLLYFFQEQGYLPHFKVRNIKADHKPIEVYTDEELAKLLKRPNLKQCSFQEYKCWVIVNFLLSTGVRQHSLIEIRIKDIDLENNVVYVNITKNRKPLIIPLNRNIVVILKEYLKYRQAETTNDYLFCNAFGQQLCKATVYRSLADFNRSRGVTTTGMHRFRHTFAKKFILMGGSVVTLQKILGHSSLEVTQNYLNILTCDIQKDMDEFNILEQFNKQTIKLH